MNSLHRAFGVISFLHNHRRVAVANLGDESGVVVSALLNPCCIGIANLVDSCPVARAHLVRDRKVAVSADRHQPSFHTALPLLNNVAVSILVDIGPIVLTLLDLLGTIFISVLVNVCQVYIGFCLVCFGSLEQNAEPGFQINWLH